ncbi:hypothetical protein ACKI1O_47545, partial [Streptomyces scabiei]
LRKGISYILKQKYLLFGIILATIINFISGIFSVALPILVLRVFNLTNLHFGFAESVNGFGYVLGGILLRKDAAMIQPIYNSWKSTIKLGIILIAFGFSALIGGITGEISMYILLFFTGVL